HPVRVNKENRVVKGIIIRRKTSHFLCQRVNVHPTSESRVVITCAKIIYFKTLLVVELFAAKFVTLGNFASVYPLYYSASINSYIINNKIKNKIKYALKSNIRDQDDLLLSFLRISNTDTIIMYKIKIKSQIIVNYLFCILL